MILHEAICVCRSMISGGTACLNAGVIRDDGLLGGVPCALCACVVTSFGSAARLCTFMINQYIDVIRFCCDSRRVHDLLE